MVNTSAHNQLLTPQDPQGLPPGPRASVHLRPPTDRNVVLPWCLANVISQKGPGEALVLIGVNFQTAQCSHTWEPGFQDCRHITAVSVQAPFCGSQGRGTHPWSPQGKTCDQSWLHGSVAWDLELRAPTPA